MKIKPIIIVIALAILSGIIYVLLFTCYSFMVTCFSLPLYGPGPEVITGNLNLLEKQDLIRLTSPQPNAVITSPLTLQGEARGTWYFEASFPVQVLDSNGKILGRVPAQAQSDWMRQDFVPFKATLEFETPTTATGTLVLKKDNPSGMPDKDDSLIIPIRFK